MSERKLISNHFYLDEFKGIMPDPRLLLLLECVRDNKIFPVHHIQITDSARSVLEHIKTYVKLEKDKKIKTLGNGLGKEPLFDVIPWDSRHLPEHGKQYLRASDIKVFKNLTDCYEGETVKKMILAAKATDYYKGKCGDVKVGIGTGHFYVHIDVDRQQDTFWTYAY